MREAGADRASVGSEGKPRPGGSNLTEEEDELAVALRTHTDTFEGVPVVSFGWVAFLIVLYILLIGPIEYFFLKRVLGRLELTWITFPIIVLTVSLAAYFTAYSLKGRELKINKVDVVDVDPASGRIYGIDVVHHLQPADRQLHHRRHPGRGLGRRAGTGRDDGEAGSARRAAAGPASCGASYRYHSDCRVSGRWAGEGAGAGLVHEVVRRQLERRIEADRFNPIPTTRSTVRSNTPGSRPGDAVIGTFVCRLPVPVLSDCVVFYAGQAYPLPGGTIRSGETVRLVFDGGVPANDWLKKEGRYEELSPPWAGGRGSARRRQGCGGPGQPCHHRPLTATLRNALPRGVA